MRLWVTLLVSALMACPLLADEIKMREFSVGLTAGTEDGYRGIQGRFGYFGLRVGTLGVERTRTVFGNDDALSSAVGRSNPLDPGPCSPFPGADNPSWCPPHPTPGPKLFDPGNRGKHKSTRPCPPPHAKGHGAPWCRDSEPRPDPRPRPEPKPRRTVVSEEDAIVVELMGYFPLLKRSSDCYVGDAPEDRDVTCRLSGVATVGLIEGGDVLGSVGVEYITKFGLVGGLGLNSEAGVTCTLGYGFTWGNK